MPRSVEIGHENRPDLLLNDGLILEVLVGSTREKLNRPQTPLRALIDTGAHFCFIDVAIADSLSLVPRGSAPVHGFGGTKNAPVFVGVIYVPESDYYWPDQIRGFRLPEGDSDFQVILGRRFLRNFELKYNGLTGKCTLTKVSPSFD